MPLEQQIQVVNAHQRIGENATVVRSQSALSYREQGYDSEVGPPAAEAQRVYDTLADLNRTYEDRFGFRFVIFVNKRPKSQIIEVLRTRLTNSRATELGTALRELFAIARDRCQQLTLATRQDTIGPLTEARVLSPGPLAVLEELSRAALEFYGEERSAEARLQAALKAAATAVSRVSQEPLDPLGNEPLPTHG